MNILHLTTHVNVGGITSYIRTLSKAMAKAGHRSSVVSSGGSAAMSLTRSGVHCYEYPIRTKSELNPKLYWALWRIAGLVRKENYDILHAHSRVTQVLAYFISKLTGVPYVSTAHGFYTPRIGRRFFPAWGERVVAISHLVSEDLSKAHRVKPGQIQMIYNAVDLDEFLERLGRQDRTFLRNRYGIPANAFVVGTLSRLVRDKGHEFLLEAARKLLPEFPNLYILIVGDGREKENLERMIGAGAAPLHDHAKIIPGVQDTTAVLSVMDVSAHPATHREGFGLSIAEAMIARVPVVATDIPAINTLLEDGLNGRVVKPKDSDALASAIRDLIQDPARARALAQKGYEKAVSICQPERMAREMEQVYREVIEARRKKT
jgi:glycosyltransferase involved in cell wall biosynthesis